MEKVTLLTRTIQPVTLKGEVMTQHPSRIRGGRMNLIKERLFKIAERGDEEAASDLKALHNMNRKDMDPATMSEFLVIEAKYPSTITVQHQG